MESQNHAFQSVGTVDQKGRDNSSMNNDADKPVNMINCVRACFFSLIFSLFQSFNLLMVHAQVIYNACIYTLISKFQSFVELGGVDDHQIRRKDFHEVHSGPNPIGNSTPQRQWLPTSHRNP